MVSLMHDIPLFCLLLLSPDHSTSIYLFPATMQTGGPYPGQLGASLTLATGFILLMILEAYVTELVEENKKKKKEEEHTKKKNHDKLGDCVLLALWYRYT